MVRASGRTPRHPARPPVCGLYGLLPMEVHSERGCDVILSSEVRINEVYTLAEYDRFRSG